MQALIALAVPALALGFAPGALNALPRVHTRAATGASEITMRTPLMAGNWKAVSYTHLTLPTICSV